MSLNIIKNSNSWQDFVAQMAPLGKKQRGNGFELLTELFLQIDPIYRSKLKHVWHESNLPPSVRHKLGLPAPEIGVDLVAQATTGEYWAIQCKYHHDPSRNLTKNELNSFLDLTARICKGKFGTLLAVTSAHDYSVNLQKHAPEVTYCLSDKFQALNDDFFRQARALIRKQTPKLKRRSPRPHQRTAIKNAIKHFVGNKEKRGKLIHPCGTGKSLIGYWIAEALEAKTVLVALPSLYLVRQTLADWTKESLALKKDMEWLVVCSEATIGDVDKGDRAMRFQEIGVDVTIDMDRIATFLRKRPKGQKVIFTTYQSGKVTAKAARKAKRIFDVGIFDEAHRTVGQKDSLFSHLIDEKNIRIRKRVFMTATERRYRGSSETILSMDDIDAYGETFDLITFKEALEQKNPILSDYRIVTKFISRTDIQQLIDENVLVKPDKGKWDDDTEARTLAALIALRKVMRKHRANHSLTFHNSIAKAKAFKLSQERFNDAVKGYGKVDCFHVSSEVSMGKRTAELEKFELSKKALITNAKCLSEGVDVPNIDAVLFADTKRSTIDIVQAAGRAMRPADGKKMAYIVVPVSVDEGDPEATDKAFQDILMTLRAMASNDDRIIDYFRSVSQGKRPSKSDSIIDFDVPDPIRIKLDDFIENIETQAWHRLAKLSWMPFEEARNFAHSLNLSGKDQWKLYIRGDYPTLFPKPADIPVDPQSTYADKGWTTWKDFLGTEFWSYEESQAFASKLGLRSSREWLAYARGEYPNMPPKPHNIPKQLDQYYSRSGWTNWEDFLEPGDWRRPLESALTFARSLKLKNSNEWRRYCAGKYPHLPPKPDDIPANPTRDYADDGLKRMGDWLGTGRIQNQQKVFREFEDAREFVRGLGLRNQTEWREYCRSGSKPDDIPAGPDNYYKNKVWVSWPDWLGTEYLPFHEARAFARKLGLTLIREWNSYCRSEYPRLDAKPDAIPKCPNAVYKNRGWISWPDWLGKK